MSSDLNSGPALARKLNARPPAMTARFRQGVVTAVDAANGACSVQLAGSSTTIAGVRTLAGVGPLVGDTVWCAQFTTDLLVVGVQDTSSAWSTDPTGFTAASNWTLNTVRWRRRGSWVELGFRVTRNATAITVTGNGNFGDVATLSAIPAGLVPSGNVPGQTGDAGRVVSWVMDNTGAVALSAAAGTGTNIASEALTAWFSYGLG